MVSVTCLYGSEGYSDMCQLCRYRGKRKSSAFDAVDEHLVVSL